MSRSDVLDRVGPARGRRHPEVRTDRVLVPCEAADVPFRWRIDPYPGCDPAFPLGGRRSSARLDRTWPKADVEDLLERELGEVKAGHRIALGADADPWPAEETTRGRTRAVLVALARREGLDVSITTRSDLVVGTLDLLIDLARRHRVAVNLVVATLDRRLAEALEPGETRPDLRLKAMSELAAADVPAGALVSPVVPWVTDHPDALDALAASVAGSGGRWIEALPRMPLPGELATTFPALDRTLPDLADRYRAAHARCPALPDGYAAGLEDLVERLRRKHGLGRERRRAGKTAPADGPQLSLL